MDIKNYEDLSDLQKLSLIDFSYSRIDTYKMCPAKYFYSYISKEPRQFAPAAVLGNIVHEVFENLVDNNKDLNIDKLHQGYQETIPNWDPEGLISADLLDAGATIIDEFYDLNKDIDFQVHAKELGFEMILGSYVVRGYIDRIDVVDDTVKIIDYKTGKWEVPNKEVPNNLQLGIYALAASQIFPDKKIYAELYYLRSGRRKGYLFTKDDLESVKVRLIEEMNNIVNDINYSPTSNVRVCSFCDHAKSGACGTGVYRNNSRY